MIAILQKIKRLFMRIFGEANTVDYMVALPSPLEPDEEARLLKLSEEGDAEARNVLVEHNLRLVVYIA
ncbi:MAG: sporulation sigma factor SigE, partial [Clostridia bacterium]|nr:sporulation sigma factor SigE [Clostridia bacterium]